MLGNQWRSVLVTGGTGSFGKKFVGTLLRQFEGVRRVVVYSRDELKQMEMAREFPGDKFPQLRFFIGDVRDRWRLARACDGVDVVVHAAALKQVPTAEYNPMETIMTNVIGAENVIHAAMDVGVKRVVALSTDKAAAPINLYGATKLCSDKLFAAANNIVGKRDLRFTVVRYGNVMGSRGSVIPYFLEQAATGVLPITDERMTRFNITLEEGVDFVLKAIERTEGGEVWVPKIPSYRILDVAEAIGPQCEKRLVGVRPGEKLHEQMITGADSLNTVDLGDCYAILPSTPHRTVENYLQSRSRKTGRGRVHPTTPAPNSDWLSVSDIRRLIRAHVDPSFSLT